MIGGPHQGLRLLAGDGRRGLHVPRLGGATHASTRERARPRPGRRSRASSAGATTRRRSASTTRSPRAATTRTCCRTRAQAILDAFRRAEVADVWGVDAIETHDCFTTSEYMAIDHFGLTAPGKSWQAIEEGVIELDGKLPINPSGGLIGCGHPVGGTGVRQVLDAYRQVTDTRRRLPGGRRQEGRHAQHRRQRHDQRLVRGRESELTAFRPTLRLGG